MSNTSEEVSFSCKLCGKDFANRGAYMNHFRTAHFDTHAQGDSEKYCSWSINSSTPTQEPDAKTSVQKALVNVKTGVDIQKEAVLSSMALAPITALASVDVSMIIMKKEEDDITPAVMWNRSYYLKKKKYICHECGKEFRLKRKLVSHLRKVHDIMAAGMKYMCASCGEGFHSKMALKGHISEKHKEVHSCPQCPLTFTKYNSLKIHYLEHADKRFFFLCDVCKKEMETKEALDEHYTTVHRLSKPYQCDLCERTFNQQHSLKVHMNATHKASTTYTCKFCSNIFNYPHLLRLHETKVHRRKRHYDQ